MDIEQEGDSVSTTVSKDTDLASNGLDGQISLEKTHNQEFGLEAGGATTDEANEESEMSVVSGAGAPAGNKNKKKRKNKRRRNKNRTRENFASDNDNSHASKVASNETLVGGTSDDKPVVVTTYVCSSSELDKVRKLIDENGNPTTSSLSTSQPISIHDGDNRSPESLAAIVLEESNGVVNSVEEVISRDSSEETTTAKIEINSTQVDDDSEAKVDMDFDVPSNGIKEEPEVVPAMSPVSEAPTEENVQSKSSINVIFKVGAAVFENQSFTGPPHQPVDDSSKVITTSGTNSPDNEQEKEEDDSLLPPASTSESEAPIEKYEQPTRPSLGELWMMTDTQSETDNSNKNKIENQEPTENELVNIDDVILNDNLINNNYLQEREPKLEMMSQNLHEMIQADIDTVLQAAAAETFGKNEEEDTVTSNRMADDDEQCSTQIELPVTRPVTPPEELTAESQNDDDELAKLSKSAVKMVLSSDKSVVANLSASSSVSSLESTETFKLPKVPNPSVENHEGLQHLVVPPLQINASSLARLMLKSGTTKKMDAAVESQQLLELPGKTGKGGSTETFPRKVETSYSSSSDIIKKKSLDKPNSHVKDLTQSGTETFSDETASEKTLTFDSERGDDDDDDDMTINEEEAFVDRQKFSSSSNIAENIENWVIDPSIIEDALTESELGEQEPRSRSSIMKNFLNCFGKRKKSSITTNAGVVSMAETMETTEASTERPTERPRSRFKSFARSLPRRK